MHRNYKAYRNDIISLFSNDAIKEILLLDPKLLLTLEAHNDIKNSENKVKRFFDEFDKIENEKKYEDLIRLVGGKIKCIKLFLDDSKEIEKFRYKYKLTLNLLEYQSEDHIKALYLDNPVLMQSRNDGLFTDSQFSKLKACLENKGDYNAKINFFMEISHTSTDWYSKLLWVYHETNVDFIPKYLPDLEKGLNQIESESEKKEYIIQYVNSTIDINLEKFPIEGERGECSGSAQSNDTRERGARGSIVEKHSAKISELDGSTMEMDFIREPRASTSIFEELSISESKMDCNQRSNTMEIDDISAPNNAGQPDSTNCYYARDLNKLQSKIDSTCITARNDDLYKDSKFNDESEDSDKESDMNFDNIFGKLQDKSVGELLNYNINKKENVQGGETLQMRKYQEELAKHGIEKKNVLICSPTGSGKTVVAVKIVQEHLKSNERGKVAFIVHRIALVEQQYTQFSRYLKCRITRLSGSSKCSSTPLIGHLNSFDLFILTSDILRNALEEENETKLESINKFTLLLFDECHNCDKKHPYNRIMTHYFKDKKDNKNLPQIIGLTASTGTDKARTMDKALKRLFTLCANLDTCIISTVKDFKEELEQNQSKPIEEIINPEMRFEDKFDDELQRQMGNCEKMLHEMNARNFFPRTQNIQAIFNIPEDRLHQKYSGFVGKLHTEIYNCTREDFEGKIAVIAIGSYLNAFARALMVNHLFRHIDAVELIKDALDLENPNICKVEKILRSNLKKLHKHVDSEQICENPSLKVLRDEIENQIKNYSNSRIIVFVKERAYTQILKSIFSSNTSGIKCEIVVGSTKSDQGGLTQNEMEEVLGRFRRGDVNVLFATTVAEEGLDIQTCNLVIRYGHVTNETAMVQSRGRARAANSKYIVIVPYKLQWQVNKENINKYRETMMYKAIAKFQEMDEGYIKEEISACQCERELQETAQNFNFKRTLGNQHIGQIWNFNCKKCSAYICKSSDIRLAEETHHIVTNVNCFDAMTASAKDNNSCQIKCKKCSSLLGNRQKFKSRLFPTLRIDCFCLICEGETQSNLYKKWRDVPFKIEKLDNQELLNFRQDHSLAM